jgi:hypothetical protein
MQAVGTANLLLLTLNGLQQRLPTLWHWRHCCDWLSDKTDITSAAYGGSSIYRHVSVLDTLAQCCAYSASAATADLKVLLVHTITTSSEAQCGAAMKALNSYITTGGRFQIPLWFQFCARGLALSVSLATHNNSVHAEQMLLSGSKINQFSPAFLYVIVIG